MHAARLPVYSNVGIRVASSRVNSAPALPCATPCLVRQRIWSVGEFRIRYLAADRAVTG